jgi:uncharacterized protein
MMRALFWLALLVLVIFAVRSKLRKLKQGAQQGAAAPARDDGEAMACCAHCHLHFPASEAVRAGGLDYCSQAHVGLPGQ